MITIPIPPATAAELVSGTRMNRSWTELLPFLQTIYGVREDERIVGIIVDEDGISIQVESD